MEPRGRLWESLRSLECIDRSNRALSIISDGFDFLANCAGIGLFNNCSVVWITQYLGCWFGPEKLTMVRMVSGSLSEYFVVGHSDKWKSR